MKPALARIDTDASVVEDGIRQLVDAAPPLPDRVVDLFAAQTRRDAALAPPRQAAPSGEAEGGATTSETVPNRQSLTAVNDQVVAVAS